ncbi:MAG: hypothetical protein PHQ40_12805 [Anaerolineaceae bacterium]|nr:hypothetical protein [Anaerolineaceae bacterium]
MIKFSTGLSNSLADAVGATGGNSATGALNLCKVNIYTGAQPASADDAASGSLLGSITPSAGATGGTFSVSGRVLSKSPSETWQMLGAAAGTMGWFRMFPASGNPAISSTTEPRIDGSVATSGGDANFNNVTVTVGSPHTLDVFSVTFPES